MRRIQCRAHPGGIFSITPKRGRQPVSCKPEYPCDRAAERAAEAPLTVNPSLPLAKAAKERLVALGWVCEGRAQGVTATVNARRGDETLLLEWDAGKIVTQNYSLFSEDPRENGIPAHRLNFEPAEVTDSELVRLISGMKVTWWNTLAGSTESGIVGKKVSIEHLYDDDTSKRIVKFIDHGGGGFRAFHDTALLKVG